MNSFNQNKIRWSSTSEVVEESDKRDAADLSESNILIKENCDSGTVDESDNVNSTETLFLNSEKAIEVDGQISIIKKSADNILIELLSEEEQFSAGKYGGDFKVEEMLQLKSNIYEKRSLLKVHMEVIENMVKNILPVVKKNVSDIEIFDALISPIVNQIKNVKEEIKNSESLIDVVNDFNIRYLIKE